MKGKVFKTKEDLTTHLKEQGLTLKDIADESGFSSRNIDSVLTGVMSSGVIRSLLGEVIATEELFEKLFGLPIADIRYAWKNKGQAKSMKNFKEKYGVVSEGSTTGKR